MANYNNNNSKILQSTNLICFIIKICNMHRSVAIQNKDEFIFRTVQERSNIQRNSAVDHYYDVDL